MPHRITSHRIFLLLVAVCGGLAQPASAQQTRYTNERYYVYDQYVPPGVAGQMHLIAGTVQPHAPQQVRITLPAEGTVTFYDGAVNRPLSVAAPAQAALMVGMMYRLKISDLADYPHTDFYPSIELIGELHPPPGQAERFPIEVEFLAEELLWAARGRMVTKVVYLEQPDRVPLRNLQGTPRVFDVDPGVNAVGEADLLGRPIAIVRLGGRTPDPNSPDPQFWGPLAPLRITASSQPAKSLTSQWREPEHFPVHFPGPPTMPVSRAAASDLSPR